MSVFKISKRTSFVSLAAAVVMFNFAAPAAAVPITYTVSGTASWQVLSLGNSGGSFVIQFDGGDTSSIGAPIGGFQYSNSPMTATISLTNGNGLVYSGELSSGTQMTLNQTAGYIGIYQQTPFAQLFGFSDPNLTTATLSDIGFSVDIDVAAGNLSGIPNFYFSVQNGSGSTDVIFQSISSLTFSEVAGASATPLPAALPLFASGLGGLGFLGWRRKRKAQATA